MPLILRCSMDYHDEEIHIFLLNISSKNANEKRKDDIISVVASITLSSNFLIEFCTIRKLTSNINTVNQHLQLIRSQILARTDTQIYNRIPLICYAM